VRAEGLDAVEKENAMDTNVEILRTIVSGIVWIVGLVTFGRLGMFIATKAFEQRRLDRLSEKQTKATDASAGALSKMDRRVR